MFRTALSLFVMLVLVTTAHAQAPTPTDARIARTLHERPEFGVLIVDAILRDENSKVEACKETALTVLDMDRHTTAVTTHYKNDMFGTELDGGAIELKPGWYLVSGVFCWSDGRRLYRGNFAKILIRPGEIVAAGTLVVDHKLGGSFFMPTFSGSSHVENFRPQVLSSLQKRAPQTLAMARKSPLLMLTEQERGKGLSAPKP